MKGRKIVMPGRCFAVIAAAGLASALAAPAGAQAAKTGDHSTIVYAATLHPMNSKVTELQSTGEARFTITGDTLMISINVKDVPPNIEHWQHFHGFKDNRN